MKSTCWDTRAADQIIKSGQKDTEASIHIFTLLPQFHMTSFIFKFVRPHGVLLFQNKHICLAIYGPQCKSYES